MVGVWPQFAKAAKRVGPILFSGPGLALAAFFVYLKTLAPGVYGFDSAELATGVFTLGIVHPPGYPLYLLLGRLFVFLPFGDVAYRLNLMSAIFAALTLLVLFDLTHRLVKRRAVAWAAGALFAVSVHFWQMALVAEVYTLHTFLLALNLRLLHEWGESGRRRYLLAFALFYGFSLANHTSGVLFAPGYGWLALRGVRSWRRDWPTVAASFGCLLLGLLPYAYLPLRAAAKPPLSYVQAYYGEDLTTLSGVWWMMSGQAYRFFAFGYDWPQVPGEFVRAFGYLWRDFMGVGVLIGLAGWAAFVKRAPTQAVGWLLLFAANVVFFANYRVLDKDTMFLPAYLVWTPALAFGIAAALRLMKHGVEQAGVRPTLLSAGRVVLIALAPMAMALNWRWVDMSRAVGPSAFAQQVMQTAAPNSIVMAQWSSAVVLEYFQIVEGQRPDLEIHNRSRYSVARFYEMWRAGMPAPDILQRIDVEELEAVNREIGRRTVYVVEYDPLFASAYEYLPEGTYFKLIPRDSGGASTEAEPTHDAVGVPRPDVGRG